MPAFEYLRPESMEQALELLGRARPMGGGTALTPQRRELQAVLDLQDLQLDGREKRGARMALGGGLRLQSLLQGVPGLPPNMMRACRLEAGWNLRNQATLAGSIVTGDGRSPLLATLLALRANLQLEPGAQQVTLDDFLSGRPASADGRLITWVEIDASAELRYAAVGRSPADLPIVCAALARAEQAGWSVVLGGQGERPIRIGAAERALDQAEAEAWPGAIEAAGSAASTAYAEAGDDWASAEYRAAVAGVLVRRLAREFGPV